MNAAAGLPASVLGAELGRVLSRLHTPLPVPVQQALDGVCLALAEGHVCLDLAAVAGQRQGDARLPALPDWLAALRAHPAVGGPGQFRPLTLDLAGRLYLTRYWCYEQRLAQCLLRLAGRPDDTVDLATLRERLDILFAGGPQPDWQKAAAACAVLQRVCVISGGPGTGKTTTVVRLLAALQQMAGGRLVIRLAAPTGKAAARMSESIRKAKPALALPEPLAASLPETAGTLHRLLGVVPDSARPRHHAGHPLALDVLVVDEASMIDLALMTKLADALPEQARLILLGDKDQLDSVEAGAVFGQLCALQSCDAAFAARMQAAAGIALVAAAGPSVIGNSVILLQHSYRFDTGSGIGELARLTHAGQGAAALQLFRSGQRQDIALHEAEFSQYQASLLQQVEQRFADYWLAIRQADAAAAFAAFGRFRLLAAQREGATGVSGLNAAIEQRWARHGWLNPRAPWYAGRPVMVAENDYALQLFNGDIGLTLLRQGRLQVAFEGEGGSLRWFNPARLPRHDTAYAMTVHKSQGSEFDAVALVLPDSKMPLLTRNLIYTGITRARRQVDIWGPGAVLQRAIEDAPARHSGLADALRGRLSERNDPCAT